MNVTNDLKYAEESLSVILISNIEDLKEISEMIGNLFQNAELTNVLTTSHHCSFLKKDLSSLHQEILAFMTECYMCKSLEEGYTIEIDYQKEFSGKIDSTIFFLRFASLLKGIKKIKQLNNNLLCRLLFKILITYPITLIISEQSFSGQIIVLIRNMSKGVHIIDNVELLSQLSDQLTANTAFKNTFLAKLLQSSAIDDVLSSRLLKLPNANLFLHIMRHPSVEEYNLIQQLLLELKNKTDAFTVHLPSSTDLTTYYTIVTFVDTPEDLEVAQKYWKVYSAIVLRIIGYGIIKQLPLRSLFTTQNYKSYGLSFNSPAIMKTFGLGINLINQRSSSFWTNLPELRDILRVQVLQVRLHEAEEQVKHIARTESKSTFTEREKRVRRRTKRLNDFVHRTMLQNLSFLIETNEIGKSSGVFSFERARNDKSWTPLQNFLRQSEQIEIFERRNTGYGSAKLLKDLLNNVDTAIWGYFAKNPEKYSVMITRGTQIIENWYNKQDMPSSLDIFRDKDSFLLIKAYKIMASIPTWSSEIVQRWIMVDPEGCAFYDQKSLQLIKCNAQSFSNINLKAIAIDQTYDPITAIIIWSMLLACQQLKTIPIVPEPVIRYPDWLNRFFNQQTFDETEKNLDVLCMQLIPALCAQKILPDIITELNCGLLTVQLLLHYIKSKIETLPEPNLYTTKQKKRASTDVEKIEQLLASNELSDPFDLLELFSKFPTRGFSDVIRMLGMLRRDKPVYKKRLPKLIGKAKQDILVPVIPKINDDKEFFTKLQMIAETLHET